MESEDFIVRAYQRLASAVELAGRHKAMTPVLAAVVLDLADVVDHAIKAVGNEGTLPSHLCTAVVKYGKAGTP